MLTVLLLALSLSGTPEVKQELTANLEGEEMLVRLVAAPKNPERGGVFIYRKQDGRWVPRFLGSGFSTITIERIAAANPGLTLTGHDAGGPVTLHCDFHGFPLECR
ncbi:MAG: hypothetical protein QM723_27090 [Myxococcaceae bacterium]